MSFSQDFIDKVRDANNIADIIAEHTELKGVGDRKMGLCPFPDHVEKTPSFSVTESMQLYHCFGCKKSGNIYHFLQEIRGLSFPEAVEYLAQRASIEIPKEMNAPSRQQSDQVKAKKEAMTRLCRYTAVFYHKRLKELSADHEVTRYCAKRGISPDIIKKFYIGYAPNDWEQLAAHLSQSQAPQTVAEELGLIRARDKGNGYFDTFRHRLMFPIVSHKGEFVGFGGRVLGDDQPKYLNSPESLVFNKRYTLYGLHETAKFIRSKDLIIVVEGYMDLIALYSAGIKNVVATLGTALTTEHANLLKRYSKNVVVLFDGDDAGQTAAERSLPILLNAGLVPKSFSLPNKMDPDDFVKQQGSEKLLREIQHAPDLFVQTLDKKLMNFSGGPADKLKLIDELSVAYKSIQDKRLRELYALEIGDRLNEDLNWVKRAFSGPQKPQNRASQPPLAQTPRQNVIDNEAKISLAKAPKSELFLLNLALKDEYFMKELEESQVLEKLSHEGVKKVFAKAIAAYRQKPSEFGKLTALLVEQTDPTSAVTQHLDKPMSEMQKEGLQKLYDDCLRKIEEAFLKQRHKQMAQELRRGSPSNSQEKLEQIMNIQRDKRALRKNFEQ